MTFLTGAPLEHVTAIAAAAASAGPQDLLFLAGSTIDGLANDHSDIDVYFVGDREVIGSATTVRRDEKSGVIGHVGAREISLNILAPSTLATLADTFHGCIAGLSQPDGFANLATENDLKILHRVRTGIPLAGADTLLRLRVDLGTDELRRYLANLYAITALNRLKDVGGEYAAGNDLSAAWMFREALVRVAQFTLVLSGETNPASKWLVRLLLREGPHAGHRARLAGRLTAPSLDLDRDLPETHALLCALTLDDPDSLAGPYLRRVVARL